MAGRLECCRYNPSLDELLEDEMMEPVLRSAGFDSQGFRDMIAETARRLDPPDERESGFGSGFQAGFQD